MGAGRFDWRILRTLSNCAIVVMMVIQAVDWYRWARLDESVMSNPALGATWLGRQHLYERIGWISLALTVGLRMCYWTIEFIHDRRLASNRGDGWRNKQQPLP